MRLQCARWGMRREKTDGARDSDRSLPSWSASGDRTLPGRGRILHDHGRRRVRHGQCRTGSECGAEFPSRQGRATTWRASRRTGHSPYRRAAWSGLGAEANCAAGPGESSTDGARRPDAAKLQSQRCRGKISGYPLRRRTPECFAGRQDECRLQAQRNRRVPFSAESFVPKTITARKRAVPADYILREIRHAAEVRHFWLLEARRSSFRGWEFPVSRSRPRTPDNRPCGLCRRQALPNDPNRHPSDSPWLCPTGLPGIQLT